MVYALTAEALQKAKTPEERRQAFRTGLLRAYEAGVDAQREALEDFQHDRPTPVPPARQEAEEDPGTLPLGPRPVQTPTPPRGSKKPRE